eukprot:2195080-Rhodomonas_salina.1
MRGRSARSTRKILLAMTLLTLLLATDVGCQSRTSRNKCVELCIGAYESALCQYWTLRSHCIGRYVRSRESLPLSSVGLSQPQMLLPSLRGEHSQPNPPLQTLLSVLQ